MHFKDLANQATTTPAKNNQRLIAIDGGGGAGKSTFAQFLQQAIPDSAIIHIDDFYQPPQVRVPVTSFDKPNPNFDWHRIEKLVFEAVQQNKPISFQKYDFKKGTLSGEIITIPTSSTVIIEGVWSMQDRFVSWYDYCFWLEAPANFRLERGVARDGEDFRSIWEEEWIPIDQAYQQTQEPQKKAHCTINSLKSDFMKDQIITKS